MTFGDKIRDESYNMILTEEHQKYQHYINMNILQVNKYYLLIEDK